jgi:hypothetical protein
VVKAVKAGDILAVVGYEGQRSGTMTISDTDGNTWNVASEVSTGFGDQIGQWWATAKHSGSTTITLAATGSTTTSDIFFFDLQGVTTLDQQGIDTTSSGTGGVWYSPSVTTTHQPEIAIGFGDAWGRCVGATANWQLMPDVDGNCASLQFLTTKGTIAAGFIDNAGMGLIERAAIMTFY